MQRFTYLVVAAAVLGFNGGAHGQGGDQLFKLLPDDGAAGDEFGFSVAISNTVALVGAPDDNYSSGSAYLFDTLTGQQIAKLLPNDGAPDDKFGYSVAISGTTVVVGAYHDGDNGHESGSAYLFDAATGQQIAKLLPDDGAPDDTFGCSVAICTEPGLVPGDTIAVGARNDDDNGYASGSVYLFNVTTGQQFGKLLPDDGSAMARFGCSVAISGTTVVVGAYLDGDNGYESGSAYVFDAATGQQIAKLLPEDGAAEDHFGFRVGISGSIAIVGASWNDDNGTYSGSAYLFDAVTAQQIAKLLPEDGAAFDHFGHSVAISGPKAIVGAPGDFSGSAYNFDVVTGEQIAKLLPDDGAVDDRFGFSVAISGTTAVVGAYWDDDNGSYSGAAYLFDAAICSADLDGDAVVGVTDLVAVILGWGTPAADVTGDGTTDVADLNAVLVAWGPCG